MEVDFDKCFKDLQKELYNSRDNLNVLNDSIRRIIGRPMGIDGIDHNLVNGVCPKYGGMQKQKKAYDGKSVFNRLSISYDETKPRLCSRVIRGLQTRQEVLEAQGSDLESRARNRRMFGSLLGTLHKFCQEETRMKQKVEKKAQIERKLEEQQFLEREMLRKERDLLLADQKKRQSKIKTLELKLERLKDFAVLERSVTNFRYCIRTKTKPSIYYRPYKLCRRTERLISNTRDALEMELRNRKLALTNELKIMDLADENSTESVKDQEKVDQMFQKSHCLPNRQSAVQREVEFKENKSRNLNEPALSSSIVVVKKT